jgi:hypothetical protein
MAGITAFVPDSRDTSSRASTRVLGAVAAARVAIGLGALVAPRLGGAVFPRAVGSRDGRALLRMIGARDLALGVATLLALRDGGAGVGIVGLATVLSDGSDAVAALGTSASPGTRAATVASGLLGAVVTTASILTRGSAPATA